MRAFVFLGPSLPVEEARGILDAVYLPPVAQGDVLRVLARRPDVIGFVDGYFDKVPSVWHKEILLALSRGVRVLGASSMGALRAAELADFGMEGVGTIYEWFRSGRLEDDDEVAIVHGPAEEGYVELSDAMVNVRDVCAASAAGGAVPAAVARPAGRAREGAPLPRPPVARDPRPRPPGRDRSEGPRGVRGLPGRLRRAAQAPRPHRPRGASAQGARHPFD